MGSINLSVHPLFYVFGFYYALTGRIFVFVIYTVCAVLHELGHSFVATSAGYRLNKITLMPFGAVVSGNVEGLKFLDEIAIALAGPFLNLAIGVFFVAVWWVYPESYAYTDIVAEANFSMALVNFLLRWSNKHRYSKKKPLHSLQKQFQKSGMNFGIM